MLVIMESEFSSSSFDDSECEQLEKIAEQALVARNLDYNTLCGKCRHVHASFLFYRGTHDDHISELCSNIFVTLIRRIGGTRENGFTPGWKDLGYHIGLSAEEINYIDNSVRKCPTETVLRVFIQNENATLDKLITALLKLDRLDVVTGICDPLEALVNILNQKQNNEQDLGYYSINSNDNSEFKIIQPKYVSNILPEVLQYQRRIEKQNENKEVNSFCDNSEFKDGSTSDVRIVKKPAVLLTYAEDGRYVASRISDKYENVEFGGKTINFICLENEKSNVLMNTDMYIRQYFEEVDYVIPIVTKGYIDIVKSPKMLESSSLDNVDCTYARFVYTLMSMEYINGTGCLNKKVRAVLPQDINKGYLSELYKFPILSVWTWEHQFDKLMNALYK